MEERNKQSNDFDLEFKLRVKRRTALLPWAAVAGLALVNSSKFWEMLDKILSRVG